MHYIYHCGICDDISDKAGCSGTSGVYHTQSEYPGGSPMVDDVLSDLSAVQSVYRLQQEIPEQTFPRTGIHLRLSVISDRPAGTAALYADFGKNNSDICSYGIKDLFDPGLYVHGALCHLL